MSYINLNGQLLEASLASVPHNNGAFRYGYGLFETMLVKDAVIELKQYHRERLFNGLEKLQFDTSQLSPELLEEEVMRTIRKNNLEALCRVRLQCFANSSGINDLTDQKPQFIIECFPLDRDIAEINTYGLTVGIATDIFKSVDSLANLKSTNALIYAIAAQQAKTNNWHDALVLNDQKNIIESTICNIFYVKDGIIHTPPLTEGCIAGVMRRFILETLPKKGFLIKEATINTSDLYNADSIFLTNAIRRVKWVATFNGNAYNSDMPRSIHNALFS